MTCTQVKLHDLELQQHIRHSSSSTPPKLITPCDTCKHMENDVRQPRSKVRDIHAPMMYARRGAYPRHSGHAKTQSRKIPNAVRLLPKVPDNIPPRHKSRQSIRPNKQYQRNKKVQGLYTLQACCASHQASTWVEASTTSV